MCCVITHERNVFEVERFEMEARKWRCRCRLPPLQEFSVGGKRRRFGNESRRRESLKTPSSIHSIIMYSSNTESINLMPAL